MEHVTLTKEMRKRGRDDKKGERGEKDEQRREAVLPLGLFTF
jgi:hypothetical protein